MTGPAHYVQAEQYATDAITARDNGDFAAAAMLAAIGQVHATLAVAAATALQEEYADIRAWRDVTGQADR